MAKLNVGDVAPGFTLPDERGQSRSLASTLARGPVVLIFYPMDNTPGCKAQLCAVRDDGARYAKAGITVYAVNNGGADSHRGFKTKNGFTAPLLVDSNLVVAAKYDAVFGLGPLRLINRTVVGIARDGRVAYYKRGSPGTDDIIAAFSTPAVPYCRPSFPAMASHWRNSCRHADRRLDRPARFSRDFRDIKPAISRLAHPI